MNDQPTPPTGDPDASLVVADTPAEFFIAGRQLFQDAAVSLEARAIVGYVLSRPPTWKVRVRDLMKQGNIGRDKLRRIFKELIHGGYMKRERIHTGGRLDWKFTVASVKKFGVYEKQCTGKQSLEIQATVKQAIENTAIYKEKNLDNIEPRENRENKTHMSSSTNSTGVGAQVREVFEHWQTTLNHPQAKLIAKRERAIRNRLGEGYTVEQIKRAVAGCKSSPHHMGGNDSHRRFDDIELICRDGVHLESFINLADSNGAGAVETRVPPIAERLGLSKS